MTRHSVASEDGVRHVWSELLCYAFTHVHNCSRASLIDCICDFYQPSDVAAGRELLWKELESVLTSETKKVRRPQQPTDKGASRPFADDIANWVSVLVNSHKDDVPVRFYAIDLKKVPPCAPEAINVFSLAARVAALEKKVESNCTSVHDLTKEVQQQDTTWPKPHSATALPKADRATAATPAPAPASFSQALSQNNKPFAPKASTTVKIPKRKVLPSQNPRASLARKQVREATKKLRVVVGKATNATVRSSKPVKHVFVYHVDKEVDAAAISEYMKSQRVTVRDIRNTAKDSLFTNSFKISVNSDDIDTVFNEEFWPDGVRCREWISHVPTRQPRESVAENAVQMDDTVNDDGDAHNDDEHDDSDEADHTQIHDQSHG